VKTLDRYVGGTVALNFLAALAALLAIFSVVNLSRELDDVGMGDYGVRQALWVVLMNLPMEAYRLVPAAALLGGVNALGGMAGRNEIVAMMAGGVSRGRLVRSVMQVAALLVLLLVFFGELAAAPLAQRAETVRSIALSSRKAMATSHGFWARTGAAFVNVREPLLEHRLGELYIYGFDDHHRMRTFTYAKSASAANRQWTLHDVVESRIGDDGVNTVREDSRPADLLQGIGRIQLLLFSPDRLSIGELWHSIVSLRERGENPKRYELVFWDRITMPLVTAIMMFLSVPLVLRTGPSVKIGQRIVLAALLGVGFQMFDETFGQLGLLYGLGPVLSCLLPPAAALGAGLWMMSGLE
jgi:lipopolysaccharide export system permease protein